MGKQQEFTDDGGVSRPVEWTYKHTPGPWNIYTSNRPDGEYEIHTKSFDEAEHICSVSGGLGRVDNDGDPFCFESAANARLIAAAPDMLEALESVHFCMNMTKPDAMPCTEFDILRNTELSLTSAKVRNAIALALGTDSSEVEG